MWPNSLIIRQVIKKTDRQELPARVSLGFKQIRLCLLRKNVCVVSNLIHSSAAADDLPCNVG